MVAHCYCLLRAYLADGVGAKNMDEGRRAPCRQLRAPHPTPHIDGLYDQQQHLSTKLREPWITTGFSFGVTLLITRQHHAS